MATIVYYQISNTTIGKKKVYTNTKLVIYKTIYLPVITYGVESWSVTTRIKVRVTAAEINFL